MTTSFLDALEKELIGFSNLYPTTSKVTTNQSYPRYNLVSIGDDYRLEILAVGLDEEDITVKFKGGLLTISAEYKSRNDKELFAHKGLSEKSFTREFTINSAYTIKNARLEKGLLLIDIIKEEQDEYLINIKA